MTRFRLRDADRTLKTFLTAFLVVLTAGYAVGLIFAHRTTATHPAGIATQFLGSAGDTAAEEIRYEKSAAEMFVFLHNHILSLSLIFLALGGVFFFSSIASPRVKGILMVEPFAAIVTTFGGIALIRFVSPGFSWLVLASGVTLVLAYATMATLILIELWWPRLSQVAIPAPEEYLEVSAEQGDSTWKNRTPHRSRKNRSSKH
jgi:hypothetical protein